MYYYKGKQMYSIDELKELAEKTIKEDGFDVASDSWKKLLEAEATALSSDRKELNRYIKQRMEEEKEKGNLKTSQTTTKDTIFGVIMIVAIIFMVVGFHKNIELVLCFGILLFICVIIVAIMFPENLAKVPSEERTEENFKNNRGIIRKKLEEDTFATMKSISYNENEMGASLKIDNKNKKIALCHYNNATIEYINFNEIIDVEILKDNSTVMKGGIGRAIVGGVLAGGVGAVVGANTRNSQDIIHSFQIRIITNNINNPLYTINLIYNEMRIDTPEYKEINETANEIYSLLYSIVDKNKKEVASQDNEKISTNYIEQLEKLSELKDKGIVTSEDFELKKKELLNKM